MKSTDSFFFFILFLLIAVPVIVYLIEDDPLYLSKIIPNYASVSFLEETVNVDDLQGRYNKSLTGNGRLKDKIKILIVPGHDEKNYGTRFGNVKEVNLNRELSEYIEDFFVKEQSFRITLAADKYGFNKKLEKYLDKEEADIKEFESFYKKTIGKLEKHGNITLDQYVDHNTASSEVAFKLYGINKFANDEEFDIVIHLHFNDYPGRNLNERGKYKGLSIYIPESEFGNGKASREFADHLFERLTKFFSQSTNPAEINGVIEDSELIAVGAFNTAEPISILVEYGYISEPQITNPELREAYLREMAYQTFVATKSFFEPNFVTETNQTLMLPHEWKINLEKGSPQSKDVLSLEMLLRLNELSPEEEKSLDVCPIDGDFDDCTKDALISFQEKFSLKATGALDDSTRDFINGVF